MTTLFAFFTEVGSVSPGAVLLLFCTCGKEHASVSALDLLHLRLLVEMSSKQLTYQKMKGIFLDLTKL